MSKEKSDLGALPRAIDDQISAAFEIVGLPIAPLRSSESAIRDAEWTFRKKVVPRSKALLGLCWDWIYLSRVAAGSRPPPPGKQGASSGKAWELNADFMYRQPVTSALESMETYGKEHNMRWGPWGQRRIYCAIALQDVLTEVTHALWEEAREPNGTAVARFLLPPAATKQFSGVETVGKSLAIWRREQLFVHQAKEGELGKIASVLAERVRHWMTTCGWGETEIRKLVKVHRFRKERGQLGQLLSITDSTIAEAWADREFEWGRERGSKFSTLAESFRACLNRQSDSVLMDVIYTHAPEQPYSDARANSDPEEEASTHDDVSHESEAPLYGAVEFSPEEVDSLLQENCILDVASRKLAVSVAYSDAFELPFTAYRSTLDKVSIQSAIPIDEERRDYVAALNKTLGPLKAAEKVGLYLNLFFESAEGGQTVRKFQDHYASERRRILSNVRPNALRANGLDLVAYLKNPQKLPPWTAETLQEIVPAIEWIIGRMNRMKDLVSTNKQIDSRDRELIAFGYAQRSQQ